MDTLTDAHSPSFSSLPVGLPVACSQHIFSDAPVSFDRWATLNFLIGPNGSGKTTVFNTIMDSARRKWHDRVKVLGTGRLGPLETSVSSWIGDPTQSLFKHETIEQVYGQEFGHDTSHGGLQLLEKRLDLQIRVLGFLRHVFNRDIKFETTRKGLRILGSNNGSNPYPILQECHGLKQLITILTFLYDDTFSVLGIDEPELHLHPQYQRFLVEELRSYAGDPDQPGKKLIFLVTHSPIILDFRTLDELSGVVMFSRDRPPQRVEIASMSLEENLKIRQILPAFHSGQRELLFSRTPILVEGHSDAAVFQVVASSLGIPLGPAGICITPMGGKTQFFGFLTLLKSFGKDLSRFIFDLDASLDSKLLHNLDSNAGVVSFISSSGFGGKTLSKLSGELVAWVRDFIESAKSASAKIGDIDASTFKSSEEKNLAVCLSEIVKIIEIEDPIIHDLKAAKAIVGRLDLIRAAAKCGNVLILRKGSLEAYYASNLSASPSDFEKRQALISELDAICGGAVLSNVANRYQEIVDFIKDSGLLKVPISNLVREPMSGFVHALQIEISHGRIKDINDARASQTLKLSGLWDLCSLKDLSVNSPEIFNGTLLVKPELGGEEISFDQSTVPFRLSAGLGTA